MKKHFSALLIYLGLLLASRPALAQLNPVFYPLLFQQKHSCHCQCCCHHDTTTYTERTNRVAFLMGPTLLLDQQGRARAGGFIEIGSIVTPRLTVGGYLMMSINRASASSFGTTATAPAYGLHSLTGRARYQLLNGRRWRVEGLAGLGAGAVWVVDRDQQVHGQGRYGDTSHAATVAFQVNPLAEVGLSGSWKVGREFWLTSQASYAQQMLGNDLGTPGDFSYWSLSVAATLPWGHRQ